MATSAESFYVFIKPKFQNQNFKSKFLKHVVNIAFEVNNHTLKKKIKKNFWYKNMTPKLVVLEQLNPNFSNTGLFEFPNFSNYLLGFLNLP